MRLSRLAGSLLLFAAIVIAFWPAFGCGFVWDDDDYVTQNPVLRTVSGIARIWFEPTSLPQYYPLVHTTFWLEYRLWGQDPLGYHVTNVVLHALSSVLLWRLLSYLAMPGALLAALWFGVHPVHVESVAWVTERKNVLSLLCYLLAAHAWLRWQANGRRTSWWIATAWFTAALLGKTVTASLPAALLLVHWWRHGTVGRRELFATLPWFVLGAALGWFTVHLEATHVGASLGEPQLHGAERLLVAGRAVWFYLASLLWPWPLCFNYPRWQLDTGDPAQWAWVGAALAVPIAAFVLRLRSGRGPLTALLLFGGTLFPALGFFDVYPFRFSFVADHFQYHASLAILAAFAAVATRHVQHWPPTLRITLAVASVSVLALLTFSQCAQYRDEPTLWQATLRCNPESTIALANLGGLAVARRADAEAKDYSERALRLDPRNHEATANLGVLAHRANDLAAARSWYERALALKPNATTTMNNLAALELQEGRAAEALVLVRRAEALDPDCYDGRATTVRILRALQRWEECLEAADWVLSRTPDAIDIRLCAIDALLALHRYDLAAGNAVTLLRQQPNLEQARRALGKAMAGLLRTTPPAELAGRVGNMLRNGGIDPASILPLLEAELRVLGAHPQADAVAAARQKR